MFNNIKRRIDNKFNPDLNPKLNPYSKYINEFTDDKFGIKLDLERSQSKLDEQVNKFIQALADTIGVYDTADQEALERYADQLIKQDFVQNTNAQIEDIRYQLQLNATKVNASIEYLMAEFETILAEARVQLEILDSLTDEAYDLGMEDSNVNVDDLQKGDTRNELQKTPESLEDEELNYKKIKVGKHEFDDYDYTKLTKMVSLTKAGGNNYEQ